MNVKNIWAVYFSATGTTKKVVTTLAKDVAQALKAEYKETSFNSPASRKETLEFTADDLVVLEEGRLVFAGTKEACMAREIIEKTFGVKRYTADGKVFFSAK